MKAVMISIQPKWVEKIANGEKTIEVRKTAPKEVPFKAYIYCCKAKPYLYKEANPPFELFLDSDLYKGKDYDDRLFSGKVIGEFICNNASELDYVYYWNNGYEFATCLTYRQVADYGKGKTLYGWHISDLKIYNKPKELWDFVHRKKYDWWDYGHHTNKPQYEWEYISRPPQSWQYVKEREK